MVGHSNGIETPPLRTPSLELREIQSDPEFYSLRNEWQTLYESCPWATPFQLFLAQILGAQRRWRRCHLQELRPESPIAARYGNLLSPLSICPQLRLPSAPQLYRRTVDPKLRRRISQTQKLLAPFSIERAGTVDVAEYMDALFLLHCKRWAAKDSPGVLDSTDLQSFHHEVARSFAERGALGLYALRHKGKMAAVLYGFRKADRFYAYISGFDVELKRASPGALLICSVIEACILSGIAEFDFLRGTEKYKYAWGAIDNANSQLILTWN